ncbi:MAG TPA: cupin domain-containing protein [Flavisolibacter sp.]|nr:cupin domain-containing protein [Flavisolibacter sp.]
MKLVSKDDPVHHYKWGHDCDGWTLVDERLLSVKQERMPAATAETLHYHQKSKQFFFILRGSATFEIEESVFEVAEGEGIYIEAGERHRIMNRTAKDLEFILCSQPSSANDRINSDGHEKN